MWINKRSTGRIDLSNQEATWALKRRMGNFEGWTRQEKLKYYRTKECIIYVI